MAMIKCKMCGGELRLIEGSTVCECEYCGTKQTVPSMDNEKKLTLFSWAGRLLRGCEFDKAAGVFETIVADFPEEAEAYWGLVLCKYGIEYVDDPATGKKIPTCHRSSFESVLDDPNYEQACENTDALARRVYRDEARQIEELRQAILQVSGKEEPYEVFISYKETDEKGERTLDSVIAQDIYTELTERGHRTFFSRISLEDKLGTEYEPYIFAALNSAKVMLVVGTDFENFDSVWVKNEWSRFLKLIAAGQKKTLIPVFKNMDAYDLPKEFAKLAAQDMGKVGAMQDLLRGVEKILGGKKEKTILAAQPQQVVIQSETEAKKAAALKRGMLALEDGEFAGARQFFDQALTVDAECAEAYYGMGLAENKCRSGEEYIQHLCQGRRDQKVDLPQDKDRIEAAVKTYCIPGYLEEDTIRLMYQDTVSYCSSGGKALAEQSKQDFESNRNFNRAIRFAADGKVPRVLSFRDQVYASLRKLTEEAEKKDAAQRQEAQNNYAAYLDKADEEAKAAFEKAQASREANYQALCWRQEQAKTEEDYQQVIDTILNCKLQSYKDCDERSSECRAAIKELKEEAMLTLQRTRLHSSKLRRILTGVLFIAYAAVIVYALVNLSIQVNEQSYSFTLYAGYVPTFMPNPEWFTNALFGMWVALWLGFGVSIILRKEDFSKKTILATAVLVGLSQISSFFNTDAFRFWNVVMGQFGSSSAWRIKNIMLIVEGIIVFAAFGWGDKTARQYCFIAAGITLLSAVYDRVVSLADNTMNAYALLSAVLLATAYFTLGFCFEKASQTEPTEALEE